jgi:hypothetical protein
MEGGICFGRGGLASILAHVFRFGCVATSVDRTLFYVGEQEERPLMDLTAREFWLLFHLGVSVVYLHAFLRDWPKSASGRSAIGCSPVLPSWPWSHG